MEIGAARAHAHLPVDQFLKRHVHALAACVAHIELDLFDRRHRLGNTVVGLLHRRKVGREDAPALDIPEHELALKRGDPPVIGEPIRYRASFVVVVNRNRISEPVLLAPVQDLWRQREQLVERAAQRTAILEITFPLHPAVVLAIADDVDLLDLIHADVGGEHRPVLHVPRDPVRIAESIGVDFAKRVRVPVRGELVGHRNGVIAEPLLPVRYRRAARIDAQDSGDDRVEALGLAGSARIGPAAVAESVIAAARIQQPVIRITRFRRRV